MSVPGMHFTTGIGAADHSASGPRKARGTTILPAGVPGHGRRAILRRQPIRIVEGRPEGGYNDVFEVICRDCGDHPGLEYSEVIPRLQWLRGPYTLQAGLAEYERHLGLTGLRARVQAVRRPLAALAARRATRRRP